MRAADGIVDDERSKHFSINLDGLIFHHLVPEVKEVLEAVEDVIAKALKVATVELSCSPFFPRSVLPPACVRARRGRTTLANPWRHCSALCLMSVRRRHADATPPFM